jgi:hypothetical protein
VIRCKASTASRRHRDSFRSAGPTNSRSPSRMVAQSEERIEVGTVFAHRGMLSHHADPFEDSVLTGRHRHRLERRASGERVATIEVDPIPAASASGHLAFDLPPRGHRRRRTEVGAGWIVSAVMCTCSIVDRLPAGYTVCLLGARFTCSLRSEGPGCPAPEMASILLLTPV